MQNLFSILLIIICFNANSQINKNKVIPKKINPIQAEIKPIVEEKKSDATAKIIADKKIVVDKTKPIVANNIVLDKSKITKDSIDLKKAIINVNEVLIDSVIVPKGKFKPFKTNAHASYYANKFTGRKSASGKIFDNNKYMAAHKKLPFGTKLKVTNEANHKTVYVEVVDRGPFIKGRELDLSSRAFRDICSRKGDGAVIVTIEVMQK